MSKKREAQKLKSEYLQNRIECFLEIFVAKLQSQLVSEQRKADLKKINNIIQKITSEAQKELEKTKTL